MKRVDDVGVLLADLGLEGISPADFVSPPYDALAEAGLRLDPSKKHWITRDGSTACGFRSWYRRAIPVRMCVYYPNRAGEVTCPACIAWMVSQKR